MKIVIRVFYVLIIGAFSGCSNDDDASKTEALFYWNQTKCADPWNTGENDSNEETEIAVRTFLENENVGVENLNFDSKSPLDKFCESCGCGTGQRIVVEVSNSDISKMEELGFYQ